MPQEQKKRGRRMKRKYATDNEEESDLHGNGSVKRQKPTEVVAEYETALVPTGLRDERVDTTYAHKQYAFFGALSDEEQEYFKRADEMLELNSFADASERELFLNSVYREAAGKELKMAQSQSCSRLMERLVQNSSESQVKQLFQAFSGNFVHLFTHRFASHCCEALFLRAAPMVSEEMLAPAVSQDVVNPDCIYVSLENLFLHTIAELEGSLGYLITDKWASHVLRVLFLVLAGDPLNISSISGVLHSKRKESIAIEGLQDQELEKSRVVPEAFRQALKGLIAESVAGLDTAQLRALATHPDGNPTLQVLLKLELTQFRKQKAKDRTSIISKLLPDDPITSDSDSASFISSLMYDPVGSHLVEQIVRYAPGKMFKSLNREIFKDRLDSFARNEVASYVVCRVLERMGQDDLDEAHEKLIPLLPGLLARNRTMVITTLIKRCTIRGVDTRAIAAQIDQANHGRDGFDIQSFLKLDPFSHEGSNANGTSKDSIQANAAENAVAITNHAEPVKIHFNLLAQAMLNIPGALSGLILDSLIQLSPPALLQIAKDPIASRTVQAALTTQNASMIQRRKLIQHYYGHIGEMALDRNASHAVDCIWEGTHGLAFIRERIAEELAENEIQLRDSPYGRAVWKNWKMDIYKHRRHEWIRQSKVKASNDGFQSFSELDRNKHEGGIRKTPLDLARERHVKQREEKKATERKVRSSSSGSRQSRFKTGPASTAITSGDGKREHSVKIAC